MACDHGGFPLKADVIDAIRAYGCEVIDVGTFSTDSVDFPDFAQLGAEKILNGQAEAGVFLCGSGVGVCIAANKIPGIYASVCHDCYSAQQGVDHDMMNVLCLGGRVIGSELAKALVTSFLGGVFNGKPNQVRRAEKIKRLEQGDMYLSDKFAHRFELGQSVYLAPGSTSVLADESVRTMIREKHIRGLALDTCSLTHALFSEKRLDSAISPMAMANWSANKILCHLSVSAAREATGVLREQFVQSNGQEGMVLLQLDPTYADDPEKIVTNARAIWTKVNRPNMMIGIQATDMGIQAAERLLSDGVNVCLTTVLARGTLQNALQAHQSALEYRAAAGSSSDLLRFAISVPIEEFGKNLKDSSGAEWAAELYRLAAEFYASAEMEKLTANVSAPWKLIWAICDCSGAGQPSLHYTETLIGKNTALAVSPAYLPLLSNHCASAATLNGFGTANGYSDLFSDDRLRSVEADMNRSFKTAFEAMAGALEARGEEIRKSLGPIEAAVSENFGKIESESMISRIFAKDPTVWTFDTQAYPEIRNRLGWLDSYKTLDKAIQEYRGIAEDLKANGFKKVLLLGMGGSSLAPEVMALTFPDANGLKLQIVDSTDPGQVTAAERAHPVAETIYVVSSKSGGTAEVRALMDYFYSRAKETLGDKVGSHFIAITDPGTLLERHAQEHGFRHIVLADASIGGRFSALSPFGILPAVLIGIDPEKIIEAATRMAKNCAPSAAVGSNKGAALGVYLGTAALNGRDKLTILTDPELSAFGSWLEQLIAESSGKNGKGIVPIDLEPALPLGKYANDRAFVYINSSGTKSELADGLAAHGHPVLTICLSDPHEIFAEFYRWEIAISVACGLLGVNAFDQPNVQDSKTRTVAKINEYKEKGALPLLPVSWQKEGITASFTAESEAMGNAADLKSLIAAFVSQAQWGEDYIAINAYLPRNAAMTDSLQAMRKWIGDLNPVATTLGFGPRFQHSTGQLHKGGANNGVFIQIVGNPREDRDVPNEGISFSVLEKAQALGDFEALLSQDRRALRIDLGDRAISDFF